jgi:hypothetical protein
MKKFIASAVLAALFLVGASLPAGAAGTTFEITFFDLTARDGVILKANVISPSTPGKHPGVIFVSSWALNDLEYLVQAKKLAEAGYVVLSYSARGFWGSGGWIDVAGPNDVSDLSAAVDWMSANPAVDATRIGAAGISYGAGISLITAGKDSRIKAVSAMSGWSDLLYSIYDQQTRHAQTTGLLAALGVLTGRLPESTLALLRDFYANQGIDAVKAWSRSRSPIAYLDAINDHKPAILMASAFGDTIFPPNQLVDFHARLTGPKRLEFAPGEHALVEAPGLFGLPNHVWDSTRRWFDQYLRGIDTGIANEPSVVLRPHGSTAIESYKDWSSVAARTQRLGLGETRWWDGNGELGGPANAGGVRRTWLAVDTVAYGGIPIVSGGLDALTGIPPTVWMPAVNRLNAGVWISDSQPDGARIRGISRLNLTITPSASQGTIVAYLYDMNALGVGYLITHTPATWLSATPGAPLTLEAAFPASGYDVPAGHRLALVIDGKDPLYLDANGIGATVTFSGPSWLDIPMR